jgi:hypothetical protein
MLMLNVECCGWDGAAGFCLGRVFYDRRDNGDNLAGFGD